MLKFRQKVYLLALVSILLLQLSNEIKYCVVIIQLLDKCLRGNKIASKESLQHACLTLHGTQHTCLTLLGTCAEGLQFYCLSLTYPAFPYCTIFPLFEQCVMAGEMLLGQIVTQSRGRGKWRQLNLSNQHNIYLLPNF